MQKPLTIAEEVNTNGFAIVDDIYSASEVQQLTKAINMSLSRERPDQGNELHALRAFLLKVPEAIPFILNNAMIDLIKGIMGKGYNIVKAIYFNKPVHLNWFVPYHQDLTIAVDEKQSMEGYGPWTKKEGGFGVRPPLEVLESNYTIRIHLDNTDEENGALRVIPKSHLEGIHLAKIENIEQKEIICRVLQGGIMIMKPLLLHASSRTNNESKRRVIHLEFSSHDLPDPLRWSEYIETGLLLKEH